jgi:phosphatidate cytidylyltransferase
MTGQNRNLLVRIATALVLFPIAVWLTWRGGLPFALLGCATSAVAAGELVRMLRPRLELPEAVGLAAAGLLPLVPWIAWQTSGQTTSDWLPLLLVAALVSIQTLHLLRQAPLEQVVPSLGAVVLAWVYCGLPVVSAVALRLRFGYEWVVMAFVVTWGNDTLAYFGGRALGRHLLHPRISPKKTWEGFAAGAAGSVLGALAVKGLVLPWLTPAACVAIGAGGALLGPLGDLSESMLKRVAGVKDSGRIIPGHGGLLDRIDALLFVAPWIYGCASWLTR